MQNDGFVQKLPLNALLVKSGLVISHQSNWPRDRPSY